MTKNTEQLVNQTYKPTVMEIVELAEEIEAAGLGQDDLVRAALACWGHQPAPPAEGEVGDEARYLAKELRDQADNMSPALEL